MRAGGGALALLFLDLERFKAVNDLLGHAAGGELLILTAARLRARLRSSDLLARLGGDQFLAVLPGLDALTAREQAVAVAEQLSDAVATPSTLHGRQVTVAASIGISICPDDATDLATLLHLADDRMGATKPGPSTAAGHRSEVT